MLRENKENIFTISSNSSLEKNLELLLTSWTYFSYYGKLVSEFWLIWVLKIESLVFRESARALVFLKHNGNKCIYPTWFSISHVRTLWMEYFSSLQETCTPGNGMALWLKAQVLESNRTFKYWSSLDFPFCVLVSVLMIKE